MRVLWPPSALRDIWRIYDYAAAFNPRAATKLAEALIAAADSLAEFPHRGRPVAGTAMRELVVVRPYIIRYEVRSDEVWIIRIRHGAQRPTTP